MQDTLKTRRNSKNQIRAAMYIAYVMQAFEGTEQNIFIELAGYVSGHLSETSFLDRFRRYYNMGKKVTPIENINSKVRGLLDQPIAA